MIRSPQLSPEQLLALLAAVIRDMPAFDYEPAQPDEKEIPWLGRADAILEASGALIALTRFRNARDNVRTYSHNRNDLLQPLHDAYGKLELLAPAASQGTFIPAGETWNGYAALVKLIQTDCETLLVVDPYVDSTIFTDFAPHCAARDETRVLTTKHRYHDGLLAAAQRWASDSISRAHPTEVRYAEPSSLHDRLIIIDGVDVWLISQSLKDIAQRSPASVTKADAEISGMKAQHYLDLWNRSSPLQ